MCQLALRRGGGSSSNNSSSQRVRTLTSCMHLPQRQASLQRQMLQSPTLCAGKQEPPSPDTAPTRQPLQAQPTFKKHVDDDAFFAEPDFSFTELS